MDMQNDKWWVLQDTDDGRNKSNDNPANSAQEAKTSSGACVRTRMTSASTGIINNSSQDGVPRVHTQDQHRLINLN